MPEPDLESEPAPPTSLATPAQPLSINSASYEDLRTLGLSVTQTGRVLAHRERTGGYESLEDLDEIPGFPTGFLDDLKARLRL